MMPFPFVVGCARSGTSLLRAMLDSHPDMAVPGESHFIVQLAGDFRSRPFRRFPVERFTEAILVHERFRKWGLRENEVRAALAAPRPTGYADAIRRLFATYARHHGKTRYGDKTPPYVHSIRLLARLFPEGRFVHIIRDGRDVVLSLLDIPEWGPTNVPDAAEYWKKRVATGRKAGRRLGPTRYQELLYEDLLADPEGELRRVCAFFELEFDWAMLGYPQRVDHLISSNLLPQHQQHLSWPPTPGLREWRQQMDASDVAAFESVTGDLLAELGYEVANETRTRGPRKR